MIPCSCRGRKTQVNNMSLRYRVYTCKQTRPDSDVAADSAKSRAKRAMTAAADLYRPADPLLMMGTLRNLLTSTSYKEKKSSRESEYKAYRVSVFNSATRLLW